MYQMSQRCEVGVIERACADDVVGEQIDGAYRKKVRIARMLIQRNECQRAACAASVSGPADSAPGAGRADANRTVRR